MIFETRVPSVTSCHYCAHRSIDSRTAASAFFSQYPGTRALLLRALRDGANGADGAAPASLYPALLLLARLRCGDGSSGASVAGAVGAVGAAGDGDDASALAPFEESLYACSGASGDMRMRSVAATVLASIASSRNALPAAVAAVCDDIAGLCDRSDAGSSNAMHGALLRLGALLRRLPERCVDGGAEQLVRLATASRIAVLAHLASRTAACAPSIRHGALCALDALRLALPPSLARDACAGAGGCHAPRQRRSR